jgi:HAE1 family hydrophobic/amphiphilic exporter-1
MVLLSFSNNFIRRPVLTTVTTLLILLVGAIGISQLPIEQLPELAPVQIQVQASYTGADAETVETTVTNVLEREINGVEGMDYITSSSTNTGQSSISVVFQPGEDKNTAQVNVQNKLSLAEPQLPPEVSQLGVTVDAQSPSILLVYRFFSEDDRYNSLFLYNYADLFILDEIKRLNGVGNAELFGAGKYAMRLWLDPNALTARDLPLAMWWRRCKSKTSKLVGVPLVRRHFRESNSTSTRCACQGGYRMSQFENLVVKVADDGNLVSLKDVGRAELGSETYSFDVKTEDKPGGGAAGLPTARQQCPGCGHGSAGAYGRTGHQFSPRLSG